MKVAILLLFSLHFTLTYADETVFLPENGNDPIFKSQMENIIMAAKSRVVRENKASVEIGVIYLYGNYKFKVTLVINGENLFCFIKQHDWAFLNEFQKHALETAFLSSIRILKNPIEKTLRHVQKENIDDDFRTIAFHDFNFTDFEDSSSSLED
uniref:Cystatin domain-containing protein n=1 Tax=Strongyloides stercoralis TaxID=6248 RepID=A0A0K0E0V2_STRER